MLKDPLLAFLLSAKKYISKCLARCSKAHVKDGVACVFQT